MHLIHTYRQTAQRIVGSFKSLQKATRWRHVMQTLYI